MRPPTLGLALIAKDEEETLPRLLRSIEGAFDQVALLDTGSTDETVEVFEVWAVAEKKRQSDFIACVGDFAWRDDFAAARNAADELLHTDWLAWADSDDEVLGAARLRAGLGHLPANVLALAFPYELDIQGELASRDVDPAAPSQGRASLAGSASRGARFSTPAARRIATGDTGPGRRRHQVAPYARRASADIGRARPSDTSRLVCRRTAEPVPGGHAGGAGLLHGAP